MAFVLYPLQAGKAPPIESLAWLPVTSGGRRADDAVALSIRFHNGQVHTVLCADRPGIHRRAGNLETDAVMEWTDEGPDR